MTMFVTLAVSVLVLLAAAGLLVVLGRAVRDDGLGHRPPPPARAEDAVDGAW